MTKNYQRVAIQPETYKKIKLLCRLSGKKIMEVIDISVTCILSGSYKDIYEEEGFEMEEHTLRRVLLPEIERLMGTKDE